MLGFITFETVDFLASGDAIDLMQLVLMVLAPYRLVRLGLGANGRRGRDDDF